MKKVKGKAGRTLKKAMSFRSPAFNRGPDSMEVVMGGHGGDAIVGGRSKSSGATSSGHTRQVSAHTESWLYMDSELESTAEVARNRSESTQLDSALNRLLNISKDDSASSSSTLSPTAFLASVTASTTASTSGSGGGSGGEIGSGIGSGDGKDHPPLSPKRSARLLIAEEERTAEAPRPPSKAEGADVLPPTPAAAELAADDERRVSGVLLDDLPPVDDIPPPPPMDDPFPPPPPAYFPDAPDDGDDGIHT